MLTKIMLLYNRLVIMSLVFFELVFAQPNFCSYEEDYYEYVPKTVNVLRKKPKKQKSAWSYLNPLNLFDSSDEHVAVKETQMILEKKKRTVTACCRGFKKSGNQCISVSDSKEKSTSQSVALSSSTSSSPLPASSTSTETVAPKPVPTEDSIIPADLSSSSTTLLVTNTPANVPKTTERTSEALPEPTILATQLSTEVSAETKPQFSAATTDAPATTVPTVESSFKPTSSKFPAETVESTPSNSVSQQTTTIMLKNEETSTLRSTAVNPSSETTTVPARENVSVVSIIDSSTASTTLPPVSVSNSLATQQGGTDDAVNPTTPADIRIIITSSASKTTLSTTESVPVASDIIRELIIGDEVTAQKTTSFDTVTTLRLNNEVPDLENKTKSEAYQTVDFIENNDITTDITPVKDHRKSKSSFIHNLVQLFLQFFRWLVQVI